MREVNPAVKREIDAVSPNNPYGEPIFRVVWSSDRFQWVSGWWNDFDKATGVLLRRVFEARQAPKYQFSARWVIERWMPPSFFGDPDMWERVTAEWTATHGVAMSLGPYPSRGDWVFVWKCEDTNGKYMDLTPTVARYAVELAMRPVPSLSEIRAEVEARQEEKDKQFSKTLDDILGDPFPFLGRTSNLNPRPLADKVSEQRNSNKEI